MEIKKDNVLIDKEIEIEKLSHYLKYSGAENELQMGEKYRNVEGIKMKLENIEYLMSDGNKGLASISNMDRYVFNLCKETPDEFNSELKLVIQKYNSFLGIRKNGNLIKAKITSKDSKLYYELLGVE